MDDIRLLIQMLHPTALADAISDYEDTGDLDECAANLVAGLYTDDTFNEYSANELQAAASELTAGSKETIKHKRL